jgi:hypothetical protein
MGEDTPPEVEAVMTKLRASLKRRGAEGIRGLGRHFKASATRVWMNERLATWN